MRKVEVAHAGDPPLHIFACLQVLNHDVKSKKEIALPELLNDAGSDIATDEIGEEELKQDRIASAAPPKGFMYIKHLNLSVFTLAHLHLHLRFGPASPYIVRPYDRDDITTTFPRLVYVAVAGTDTYTTIWIDIHKPIDIGELARLALPPVRPPAVEGDANDKRRHSVDLPATTDRFLDEQTKLVIKKGGALLPPSVPLQGDMKSRNTITKIDEPVVSLEFESAASEPGHAVTIITALNWINGAVPTAERHAWRHRPEWHGQEYPMLVNCHAAVLEEFAEILHSRQPLFLPIEFKLIGNDTTVDDIKRYLSRLAECYEKGWDRRQTIDKRLDFVKIHAKIPLPARYRDGAPAGEKRKGFLEAFLMGGQTRGTQGVREGPPEAADRSQGFFALVQEGYGVGELDIDRIPVAQVDVFTWNYLCSS